ncbi:hypothetical protein AWENTII_006609 [Aspergillus wentii]
MDSDIKIESQDTLSSRNGQAHNLQRGYNEQLNQLGKNFQHAVDQLVAQQHSWLRESLAQKESELRKANRRILKLEDELDDCHAQIFRFIPTYEISDATISNEYIQLRENVSNWMEGLPDITRFADTYEPSRRGAPCNLQSLSDDKRRNFVPRRM